MIHRVAKSGTRLSDWTELNWTESYVAQGPSNYNPVCCIVRPKEKLIAQIWLRSGWLKTLYFFLCSVQFNRSVVSHSLRSHELQHARPPCPSPTPGVYPNSCPSSRWCHLTISSSRPFSSCLQSFPTSGSFKWVRSSHQVAKILEYQFQHQSFQWTPRTDLL